MFNKWIILFTSCHCRWLQDLTNGFGLWITQQMSLNSDCYVIVLLGRAQNNWSAGVTRRPRSLPAPGAGYSVSTAGSDCEPPDLQHHSGRHPVRRVCCGQRLAGLQHQGETLSTTISENEIKRLSKSTLKQHGWNWKVKSVFCSSGGSFCSSDLGFYLNDFFFLPQRVTFVILVTILLFQCSWNLCWQVSLVFVLVCVLANTNLCYWCFGYKQDINFAVYGQIAHKNYENMYFL